MKNLGINSRLIAAVTILVAFSNVWVLSSDATSASCILNCAQCVQLYGDFFDGHSCAQVCMENRGKFESYIDCADPTNIARFIKTLSKNAPPDF